MYIGNIVDDGSAIYAQSDKDYEKYPLDRSFILIDWQGGRNWIGTVTQFLSQHILIITRYITLQGLIYHN